jgi:hypothetical protein
MILLRLKPLWTPLGETDNESGLCMDLRNGLFGDVFDNPTDIYSASVLMLRQRTLSLKLKFIMAQYGLTGMKRGPSLRRGIDFGMTQLVDRVGRSRNCSKAIFMIDEVMKKTLRMAILLPTDRVVRVFSFFAFSRGEPCF